MAIEHRRALSPQHKRKSAEGRQAIRGGFSRIKILLGTPTTSFSVVCRGRQWHVYDLARFPLDWDCRSVRHDQRCWASLLLVDLYGGSFSEAFTFQNALVWCECVIVGYGHRIYVIDRKEQLSSEIFPGTCCGYLFSKQGSCDDQGLNFPPHTRDL